MYRIISGRATGKTSQLMLLAKENNGTIVCSNPNAMKVKAENYGIIGINFISYHDFLNSKGKDLGKYYIDELESFVKHITISTHGQFDGYTISEE